MLYLSDELYQLNQQNIRIFFLEITEKKKNLQMKTTEEDSLYFFTENQMKCTTQKLAA